MNVGVSSSWAGAGHQLGVKIFSDSLNGFIESINSRLFKEIGRQVAVDSKSKDRFIRKRINILANWFVGSACLHLVDGGADATNTIDQCLVRLGFEVEI